MQSLLSKPADAFLWAAEQLPGPVLGPYVDHAEAFLRDQIKTHLPQFYALSEEFVASNSSPFAARLPLMNPYHVAMIVAGYLLVIFTLCLVMKFLPPFKLRLFAMFHNTFLMSLSAYMMTEILNQAFIENKYSFWGNDYDRTERGFGMAKIIWLFYISKIFEFLDTVIMALKKNNRQISFLHLYHHGTIFAIWWLVTVMAPGGDSYYSAALNSFIHVVMYGYYLLSSLGFKKVSFIKHYITMMQMTQFVTMMLQAVYDITTGGGGYPALPTKILFFYMITLLALFLNFFRKDRARRREELRKAKAEGPSTPVKKSAAKKAD